MHNQETLIVFQFNHRAIGINLKDLTHEESLVSNSSGGNSINWILGHIIINRDDIFELLGMSRERDEKFSSLYSRGTQNIASENALLLEKLLEMFNSSQKKMEDGVSGADLSGDPEKLKRLTFLAFHEAYHVGQTGILRRIAGKEGAIK
ncbi:MAG TPA: DinB family protein [Ignavibacteria bacterium]|nr:DinB family protein [Ignavibacteria bacterium]